MSSIVRWPPITRLETGQDTNWRFGSTIITSIDWSDSSRMYFETVAPP